MRNNETPVSELMEQLSDLPSDDDVQALTDSIEDLTNQIAASNSGAGIDRNEISEIAQEEAMNVNEHLVADEDCSTERCAEWRADLITLVNERNVPAPDEDGESESGKSESQQEEGESEGEVEEVESADGPIFSDGGWATNGGSR